MSHISLKTWCIKKYSSLFLLQLHKVYHGNTICHSLDRHTAIYEKVGLKKTGFQTFLVWHVIASHRYHKNVIIVSQSFIIQIWFLLVCLSLLYRSLSVHKVWKQNIIWQCFLLSQISSSLICWCVYIIYLDPLFLKKKKKEEMCTFTNVHGDEHQTSIISWGNNMEKISSAEMEDCVGVSANP